MDSLNDKQKMKLEKLATFADNKDLAIFDEVQEIAESLKTIAQKPEVEIPKVYKVQIEGVEVLTLKGDDGETPTDEHLIELISPLIPEPIPGKDYILTKKDKEEIASKIRVPVVEKIIEKTEIIHEQPIVTNEIKEVAVKDTGEEIIEKINEDESEKRIKREKVEGLDDAFNNVNERISSISRGGARSNNSTKFYPLTADGSTKIFSVPKSVASIVLMSDFPHILFENNGFTLNATRTQLTLTVDNAPSLGSQLLYQYSSMFN